MFYDEDERMPKDATVFILCNSNAVAADYMDLKKIKGIHLSKVEQLKGQTNILVIEIGQSTLLDDYYKIIQHLIHLQQTGRATHIIDSEFY